MNQNGKIAIVNKLPDAVLFLIVLHSHSGSFLHYWWLCGMLAQETTLHQVICL